MAPAGPGPGPRPPAPPRPAAAARRRAAGAAGAGPGAAGRRAAAGARRQAAGAARARAGRRRFLLRGAGPHIVHVLGHGGRGHDFLPRNRAPSANAAAAAASRNYGKGQGSGPEAGARRAHARRDKGAPLPPRPPHRAPPDSPQSDDVLAQARGKPSGHLPVGPQTQGGGSLVSIDRRRQQPPPPKSGRELNRVRTSASKIPEPSAEPAHKHQRGGAGSPLVQSPLDTRAPPVASGYALETRMRVGGRRATPPPPHFLPAFYIRVF